MEKNQVIAFYNTAADQVTNILKATGQNVDANEVKSVVDKLRGKKIEDVIIKHNFRLLKPVFLKSDQLEAHLPQQPTKNNKLKSLLIKRKPLNPNQLQKRKKKVWEVSSTDIAIHLI